MNIGTYLLIGLVVQIIVTAERYVLGKWNFGMMGDDIFQITANILLFLYAATFNVITWPIAILFEVYNFVKGY